MNASTASQSSSKGKGKWKEKKEEKVCVEWGREEKVRVEWGRVLGRQSRMKQLAKLKMESWVEPCNLSIVGRLSVSVSAF